MGRIECGYRGPDIVGTDLILWLDGNSRSSYQSFTRGDVTDFGTTWGDITGNNRSGSMQQVNNNPSGSLFRSQFGGYMNMFGNGPGFVDMPRIELNYTQTSILSYTIEAWVRIGSYTFVQPIVTNRGSGAGVSLTLALSGTDNGPNTGANGRLWCAIDSNSIGLGPTYTGERYDDNVWHQLVGTLDIPNNTVLNNTNETTYIKLFADGQAKTTNISGWGANSATSPFTGLGKCIIAYHDQWNRSFQGDLGLVRIYNRALTASEVLQNYNTTKTRFGL